MEKQLTRKAVARQLGLLLQIHDDAFPLTVMDSALMGHYPRTGLLQWPGKEERAAVREALERFDLHGIESRIIGSLSGGERERVALATLMVQDPAIWLLDEPTVSLDVDAVAMFGTAVRSHLAGGGMALIATHIDLGIEAETLDVSEFRAELPKLASGF